ncbi:hypothetical protein QCA50_000400 [Cerrena zonata]|uniref:Uncharacterized protein n=1 Tax=Cerrena zonata TaxID=2478898 RepID=A0AAW0GXW5_9APHY
MVQRQTGSDIGTNLSDGKLWTSRTQIPKAVGTNANLQASVLCKPTNPMLQHYSLYIVGRMYYRKLSTVLFTDPTALKWQLGEDGVDCLLYRGSGIGSGS